MTKSNGNLLMLACCLFFVGLMTHKGTSRDFELHSPYANGRLAAATIVSVVERTKGKYVERVVTVEYKDEYGKLRQGVLEKSGLRIRQGQKIEISYRAGNYSTVRWPDGRISDKEHGTAKTIAKVMIGIALLCLLVIAVKIVRGNRGGGGYEFSKRGEMSYVLRISYSRVIFQGFAFVFFFGLAYVILYLFLFYVSGLPLATAQIIFLAFIGVLLLALWNLAGQTIGHPPLKLTREGFSIYRSGQIPWQEISHIKIQTHHARYTSYSLNFFLTPESEIEPTAKNFGHRLNPPRMQLSLESVCWDEFDLKNEIIHFALEGRDNEAIRNFRLSHDSSTGSIHWPDEESMSDTNNHSSESPLANKTTEKKAKNKSSYMGRGFHIGNH